MEVDPPAAGNVSTPIHGQLYQHGYSSRDLESSLNGSDAPAPGVLKRSSSAPMINVLVTSSNNEVSPTNVFQSTADPQRSRRFSSNSSVSTPIKVADRLNQLKKEESHIAEKDIEREREVRSAIKISTSWTEFSLGDHEPMMTDNAPRRPRSFSESLHIFTSPSMLVGAPSPPTRVHQKVLSLDSTVSNIRVYHEPMMTDNAPRRPRSFSESLHIFTSPSMLVAAPSPPTRVHQKQCYSPSMQAPIKNHTTFTPSPSPSPTRKQFVRSLSPIAGVTRPFALGKRRLEPDGDNRFESYMSPPKRFHTGPSTPDRLIHVPHPLAHSSISSSSFEGSSPEQNLPRTASILQTVPIGSRPQPHMYGFMPLRDSQDMQTTDSETSDVTESTDMSEAGDSSSGMLLSTSETSSHAAFTPVKQTHL